MASRPAVECPICHEELDRSEDLETHLLEAHTPAELAESIVSDWEGEELGDVA